jgi:hypothetical protein
LGGREKETDPDRMAGRQKEKRERERVREREQRYNQTCDQPYKHAHIDADFGVKTLGLTIPHNSSTN